MGPPKTSPRRRPDGERTHASILEAATQIASVDGLNGLSIGRLAAETGVSKSGLFAHFGSKVELQLETIQAAGEIFQREVIAPAFEAPAGLPRLEAQCEAYMSYVERLVFPGGCFFAALLGELDAQTGPVHDAVVSAERVWIEHLTELAREAQRQGEVEAELDPEQLAFELEASMELANHHFLLFRDPASVERGRRAVKSILERVQIQK